MRKHIIGAAAILMQLIVFYLVPLFAGAADAMGMVSMMLLATFTLSAVLGAASKTWTKYMHPIIAALAFVPSVFIYYNESALIHAIWYFAASAFGVLLGAIVGKWIT